MNIHEIAQRIRAFADELANQNAPLVNVYTGNECHVTEDGIKELKPALAMPPDGRPLRNEDELTAEQVGAGYRLTIKEDVFSDAAEVWSSARKEWLPLSVPWPLQLPPPPPGMKWHREDGWKADDLPPGTRPLADGEAAQNQDQVKVCGSWLSDACDVGMPMRAQHLHTRTTRPLTFQHAGKQWAWHRPGDPIPCDGGKKVQALCHYPHISLTTPIGCVAANVLCWDEKSAIIGWRNAEPETVPLGPEDVPPGSVLQHRDEKKLWSVITSVSSEGVIVNEAFVYFRDLHTGSTKINRSIPTGKWDANAWEPCSKEVPA